MAYRPKSDRPTPFPVPGWMWDPSLGQSLYDQRIRYMRRIDELGFDGLIFTEHHYGPNGGLTPSPNLMMAAASQVTERVKLITMGIILALHGHPVRVAEELAMVDNLSHGRVVAGFISGNAEAHYAYNMPGAEGRARHREAFDLLRRAWTEENPFEWHGEFFDYDCVSILPRPVQRPHPEVWTASGSAESIEFSASRHINLVASGPIQQVRETLAYYQRYAQDECSWTPTSANLGMSREFFMAPHMDEVRDVVENVILRDRADAYDPAFEIPALHELEKGKYTERSYDFLSAARSGRDRRGGRSLEDICERGIYIVGDPDAVTEQIIHQHDELGTEVLVIRPEMGHLSLDQSLEMLELFAREVLPVVQKL
jgi:alkanesulfonate monooxygenase SsuD/methylene tetrahydromethanopterin reductase-like flavin-dependent oxidoreductase (luciferase family)